MKKYLIFAASALVLASCSSDDFLGENPGNVQNATTAINFGGDAGKITRGTKNEGDDHVKLDNQFKVYGWKTVSGTPQKVFDNYSNTFSSTVPPYRQPYLPASLFLSLFYQRLLG